MKTSELTGAALDWAVCLALGRADMLIDPDDGEMMASDDFDYSTDWAQGGSIIERERIGLWPSATLEGMWAARPDYEIYPDRLPPAYGPTPLIAAMRCYVASKLGDEVDVPEELL